MHKPVPKKKPWRFMHDDVHPTMTHGAIALGGFLLGVLTVGALAVNAASVPAPSLTAQVDQLKLDVAGILSRLTGVESRLTKLDGGAVPAPSAGLGPISSCESLTAALPASTNWASRSSSVTCASEAIVGLPQKTFLRVRGTYQYADNTEELQDIVLEIYDLGSNAEARTTFITKSAYEATDFNLVKRTPNTIGTIDGVFTYEGLPVPTARYIHGANWFVYKERYGILVHGSPTRLADKTKLDDLVSKVNLEALAAIQ
ncbi:MAG TPA: hypothetical protein VN397_00060 [Candidatus Methylomirabilis sp.]|nr:hypothetical protein [Candidatus Methylomirabilis sp.]